MVVRIQRVDPVTYDRAMTYCPICGSFAKATQVALDDYMEELARDYDLPIELMRKVYELWDPKEHPLFSDFYEELKSA